jgi:cytochrome o ubiquinol oxidase subunit II
VAKAKKTTKRVRWAIIAAVVIWFFGLLAFYLHKANFQVLNPAGQIAGRERHLMLLTIGMGMIVLIPVYVMTFLFAWRYREGNKNAKYQPDMSGNWLAETVWWVVPGALILVLCVITWNTSHSLDPGRALVSSVKPMRVQVVALDWKWLFIYPDQNVASVNEMAVPVGTPLQFDITADAPMNSFWIPQLGGQIYAMPGMATHLNLIADKAGSYDGLSANISGRGFSGMRFQTIAGSESDFSIWLQGARLQSGTLDMKAYNQLSKPSTQNAVAYYSSVTPDLFNKIVDKYMTPGAANVR